MCKRRSQFRKDTVAYLESQNTWTMAKKPRIYDCYGVLEKIAWIWRILLIFPFTIQYPTGIKKYKINKIFAVYSFLFCSACIINMIYCLIKFQGKISLKRITMTISTILIRAFSSILCIMVSSIWRIFRHKELTECIESMVMQESFLEKMGCRFNHEKKAKIVFTYVLSTFFIMVWLFIYDLYTSDHVVGRISVLLWITPLMIQVINLTLLVSLVGLLGLKFRALNEKIKLIVTRTNASSPKVIVTSEICAENLRLAAKSHYNLCAVGKQINSFFNWDVIINVTTAFVILSLTLYYIFVEVQREGKTNVILICTYIHWEFIHSVPIIIIVIICNWTTTQSIYAGTFIHEIRVDRTDSRLYEAFKSFSLQLHHQKLEFTGGGLFPLNSTLLQTMIGNITTYLIILIQFHPSLDY